MTTTQFIKVVAEKAEISQKDAKAYLNALVDAITEATTAGEDVRISGLGTFKVTEVPERTGVNRLGDGGNWVSPAHNVIRFKVTKTLKDAVAGK